MGRLLDAFHRDAQPVVAGGSNGPSPIRLLHGERTLLDALRFVVWHEGLHLGQISMLRSHHGLTPVVTLIVERLPAAQQPSIRDGTRVSSCASLAPLIREDGATPFQNESAPLKVKASYEPGTPVLRLSRAARKLLYW